ncbi:CD48 antigen-like [Centropristis striata]|uniref:CD48 antigen-like n=1 Tax=Centropristis striata TaxID=184440 RepID=UPI0027E05C18|nr:CD48 antigen-like [Centropristis striata]
METLWRVVLLLVVLDFTLAQNNPTYVKKGWTLTLDLRPPLADRITSILWKLNGFPMAELVETPAVSLDYYYRFEGRSTLDITTGRLEINSMTTTDSGRYTVEVNNKVHSTCYDVKVIEGVPKPMVVVKPLACGPESDQCKLTCVVENPEAEPVRYSWKGDDGDWTESGKDLIISKRNDSSVKNFTCRVQNPVSLRDSEPQENLLFEEKPEPQNNPLLEGNPAAPRLWVLVLGSVVRSLAILALLVAVVYVVWLNRETVSKLRCLCRSRKGEEDAASYVNDDYQNQL